METKKNLGIWMDHSSANFIDLDSIKNNHSIASKFTSNTKEEVLNRSEYTMHNKEEQMQEAFYKEISEEISKYNHVVLFGPTNAKSELHNYLKNNSHFKDIKIDVKSADKMTDNEKNVFVKNHFEQ
ncbi:hypothetical protein [Aequorivita sp. CIP111184]|uniref:hypothetical protein n=1 Tax=Aequorivita sp. CIP111184 TaxID=2211356 RepID=UPI000DBC29D1|nr:hypothetical protein [Aequorivita sp. CIP111184]SRX55452.1 hypothetical protein AEQU1_02474 [Aequorivita sp. CIP111184]